MKYGILGPYMSATDRRQLLEWFRRVDVGPFATIATGESALGPQIEEHAFLAAAAAVTERVAVMSHVMIVPMHPPVLLAKRLGSIDVISGGRFVVGIGTGGGDDDYRAGCLAVRLATLGASGGRPAGRLTAPWLRGGVDGRLLGVPLISARERRP